MRSLRLLLLPVLALLAPTLARAELPRRQTELPPISLLDGSTLGERRLGFAFAAGYPFVQAIAAANVSEGLDLGLEVDSVYGAATQLGFGPKLRLWEGRDLALAASLQGQWTFFRHPADEEDSTGVRHLTGLRNWGIQPGLVLSTHTSLGNIFGAAYYQATFATEPSSAGPLAGAQTGLQASGNLGLHVGAELVPGTSLMHLYGLLGLDFHLRAGDAPVAPRIEVGFTFPG